MVLVTVLLDAARFISKTITTMTMIGTAREHMIIAAMTPLVSPMIKSQTCKILFGSKAFM
jgi:hypothetical protein